MSFDLQRFLQARIALREKAVPVPDLAGFFPEGAEPVFVVRALSGEEIFRAADAGARDQKLVAAVQAIAGAAGADKFAEGFRDLLGAEDVPEDMRRRIEHLLAGVVEPKLDREAVLRLIAFYPTVAGALHNEILILISQGPDLGKAGGSTETPPSTST
jgi:hypothetical protein